MKKLFLLLLLSAVFFEHAMEKKVSNATSKQDVIANCGQSFFDLVGILSLININDKGIGRDSGYDDAMTLFFKNEDTKKFFSNARALGYSFYVANTQHSPLKFDELIDFMAKGTGDKCTQKKGVFYAVFNSVLNVDVQYINVYIAHTNGVELYNNKLNIKGLKERRRAPEKINVTEIKYEEDFWIKEQGDGGSLNCDTKLKKNFFVKGSDCLQNEDDVDEWGPDGVYFRDTK